MDRTSAVVLDNRSHYIFDFSLVIPKFFLPTLLVVSYYPE